MENEKQNLYEGMYVVDATIGDQARTGILDRIKSDINKQGGNIIKVHDWGRKRLAYEINGRRDGYYFIIYFEVRPSAINELWREYNIDPIILRFLTLRVDEPQEEIKFKHLGDRS